MGSVPGMACLLAIVGFWLLMSAHFSGPAPAATTSAVHSSITSPPAHTSDAQTTLTAETPATTPLGPAGPAETEPPPNA